MSRGNRDSWARKGGSVPWEEGQIGGLWKPTLPVPPKEEEESKATKKAKSRKKAQKKSKRNNRRKK